MTRLPSFPAAHLRVPLLTLLVCAPLTGCGMMSSRGDAEQAHSVPPNYGYAVPAPSEPDGAIFRAGQGIKLFEDLRARNIGDILTVSLVEQTNATKSSTVSTSKTTDATINNPTVFGYPVTRDGVPILSGSLGGEQAFSGEGGASISNRLEGSVTVTVVERLPNGNLVVQGEKWLTLNQGREFVRLSGIVRPVDIEPDNSVSSEKVANARIEYSGKGALADSNRMNWLARFFNSPWVPF